VGCHATQDLLIWICERVDQKSKNEWRRVFLLADKFTQHNFQEVMEHEEFLLLPLTQLIDIISSGMPG